MNTLLIRLVNSTKRVLTSMVAPDRALEFSMMRRPKYSRAPFLGLPIGTYFIGECAVVLNVRSLEDFSEIKKRGKFIKEAIFQDLKIESKFIKIIAENFEELPSWHEAAGSKCWIFTDEIIIR